MEEASEEEEEGEDEQDEYELNDYDEAESITKKSTKRMFKPILAVHFREKTGRVKIGPTNRIKLLKKVR